MFASQRAKVEQLVQQLTAAGVKAGAIHGDMDQVGAGGRGGPGGGVITHVGRLQRSLFATCGRSGTGSHHLCLLQYSRMAVLDGFRAGKHHVLVATDVAARGLDIKTLRTVVNYDAPKEIDTHIHR